MTIKWSEYDYPLAEYLEAWLEAEMQAIADGEPQRFPTPAQRRTRDRCLLAWDSSERVPMSMLSVQTAEARRTARNAAMHR